MAFGQEEIADVELAEMKNKGVYRSILENISQPVILVDKDLTIIYANKSRGSHQNSSDKSVIGEKCFTVSHGFDQPCWNYGITPCPAITAFEEDRRTSATHKHLIDNEVVVEEIFSTPFNGYVINEFRNVSSLLGLRQGILPICAWCNRIRDESGDWHHIESYLHRKTGTNFSHTICKECKREVETGFNK